MSDNPLLEIQRLDTEADQLRHRRASLPARAARDGAAGERRQLDDQLATVAASRIEVATRQKRFEDEAQIFAAKADTDDQRLYGGEVGVKEMQALQDEIAGLRARQRDLEEQAIVAMEEAEELADTASGIEARIREVQVRIDALDREIADGEAEIDGLLAEVEAARAGMAADVAPQHLALYERLRPGLGSATAVRFDGKNCVGCPSTMPAMEVDRMKHEAAGSVQSCEECGRIVVL
ncbi:MAG: hypothetical protein R2695_15695 [Acidimicrobiales bacterium]